MNNSYKKIVLPIAFLFLSCCSFDLSDIDKVKNEIIVLDRYTGGGSPHMTRYAIFSDGTIAYQPLGGRLHCRSLDAEKARIIMRLVSGLAEVQHHPAPYPSEGGVQIWLDQKAYQLSVVDPIPEMYKDVLSTIERIFEVAFGREYGQLLCPEHETVRFMCQK